MNDWDRAVANFLRYLPPSVEHWVVGLQPPAHERIAASLIPQLPSAEIAILDDMPPAGIREMVRENCGRPEAGFLEFSVNTGEPWDSERREAMAKLAGWPRDRVKRCFDVWDANFSALFAEDPAEVSRRCYKLRDAVAAFPLLEYRDPHNTMSQLNFGCAGAAWTAYTGFEAFDHVLPSGEVSCLPRAVHGQLEVEGWIVGTIPFGLKYGYVRRRDLLLDFEGGQVTAVTGRNRSLCADLNNAFSKLAGLSSVGELGIGQSTAVAGAAMLHEAAHHWLERHIGIHVGLGVELPEAHDPERDGTGHHLDIVLATGALVGDGTVLAEW